MRNEAALACAGLVRCVACAPTPRSLNTVTIHDVMRVTGMPSHGRTKGAGRSCPLNMIPPSAVWIFLVYPIRSEAPKTEAPGDSDSAPHYLNGDLRREGG